MISLITYLIFLLGTNLPLYQNNLNLDEHNLLQDIQALNWSLESCSNVNEMFDTFNSELMNVVDTHIPLKQLSKKKIKLKCIIYG